ncbi:MAG: hypothetical protein ACYCS8_04720 [Acidithiobacillus sp.]
MPKSDEERLPMSADDCLRYLEESGDVDTYFLLMSRNKTAERRFNKACDGLKKLLDDVRVDFPDACYYTASGGLNLLLGAPHDENFRPRSQLTALGARNGLALGDGDY